MYCFGTRKFRSHAPRGPGELIHCGDQKRGRRESL
jgi:hypothetical protein